MMPASSETENMEVIASDVDTGSAEIDLSSRDLQSLPEDILTSSSSQVTQLLLDYNDLESLPEHFSKYFPNLEVLSLTGNEITSLPVFTGCVSCLRELYFNENCVTELCESICGLTNLQVLKATGNSLQALPENIGELRNLQTLCLDDNKLESLPSTLGLLESLEILELEENKIDHVNDGIGRLKCLRILNMCNNKLKAIPEMLGDLNNLEAVDLSGNFLKFLPSHFNSACRLKKLYADRNQLAEMPDWIEDLYEAVELSLKDNKFHNEPFSDRFGENCKKLKLLDFGGNFMTKLPDSIGKLRSLEKFFLGSVIDELERWAFQNGNWLSYLPNSIGDLANLKEIHLNENLFQALPEEFGNLACLEFLDLGQNLLSDLPESFGNLKSLKFCQLSKNKLQLLPSSFGNLTALQDLRLDNNLLEELPESFSGLINLNTLDLFNNKLSEIPTAIEYFTKLIRLDLNENKLSIPWQEVPTLRKKTIYAKRDPNLRNNWRGRPRQDLLVHDDDIKSLADKVSLMEREEDESEEEDDQTANNGYSQDLYRRAAELNLCSSIWRSHTGPQKREKYVHQYDRGHIPYSSKTSEEIDEASSDSKSEEFNGDDNFEPPLFFPKTRKHGNQEDPVSKVPEPVPGEGPEVPSEPVEDWDAEIEEIQTENPYDDFNNIYQHPRPKTLAEAGYEVDEHLFLPYDIHTEPIIKYQVAFAAETGQFDDADEDEEE
ncbi:leucine-rich repeat protein lrrA-like [Mizuhopecten yessoensis]|uniref:Leucine-rich repeat protein soc-2-like n=1 Tax=Mizuhopecten yessoensis TaxID=6573 RepID=A0A210QNH0_MIZYE|nr:leucine-rich repeat protein lrrA-like [Mizuhopecten yessoensis]XP_021353906.1 leucine-rich repeat protein lrrA-like [Mizuhopecten yessoensis]OWF50284.1 Leucine-rich repeat protein soc-2-like [Mizuhopecten yessoensis]